jgi:flagellar protein FlaJ
MLGVLAAVDILAKPYAESTETLEIERTEFRTQWSNQVQADPDYDTYESRKQRAARREKLDDPIGQIRDRNPLLSLAFTVPVALVAVVGLVATGVAPTSLEGMFDNPVTGTISLFILPFLIVSAPLAVFHEMERRRKRGIAKRFPDTLNILSSANQMGIRLVEALNLVSRWSEGALSEELRKVRNDIEWNEDVERALLNFANRLRVPQVTRTMKLIAKGNRSSSNLSRIISIAAEDTRNRYQIERRRRSEMGAYTAIVVIGFLVYLAVIVMLDTSYLTPISELSQATGASGRATQEGSVTGIASVGDVPVGIYRTVFLHSALIQGIGSGLLAGKLSDNEVLSGLKYSIALVVLTTVIFVVIA